VSRQDADRLDPQKSSLFLLLFHVEDARRSMIRASASSFKLAKLGQGLSGGHKLGFPRGGERLFRQILEIAWA
jgi:hypothetical protein